MEISSHGQLNYAGQVDATATQGLNGSLLLDPQNIEIVSSASVLNVLNLASPTPAANSQWGSTQVFELKNNGVATGNIAVASYFDSAVANYAGAVRLYNGSTGALISSLTGSTPLDYVGRSGLYALNNGNFVVSSSFWTNGVTSGAYGAATWINGATGLSGTVNSSNSLVGAFSGDSIGSGGIKVLSNGNYVVLSPSRRSSALTAGRSVGAATWGSGTSGVNGTTTISNSLIGSTAYDYVGSGMVELSNGNYVVISSYWGNGTGAANAGWGAVTWGNGATGTSGAVGSGNSLVGARSYDKVGDGGVTALLNGAYVVASPFWNLSAGVLGVGAVTQLSGIAAHAGTISASNSLVGSSANDHVGLGMLNPDNQSGTKPVVLLSDGNYVVNSSVWSSGRGAVTRVNSSVGTSGTVSAGNSVVGTTAGTDTGVVAPDGDKVGGGGISVLSGGNFVVSSPNWYNGSAYQAGAVTWVNGASATGTVSATNSLVGTNAGDMVGSGGVTVLPVNGNYVVASPNWALGASTLAVGAVTWASGSTGISNAVTSANSLVGSTAGDNVGARVTALVNGNYVVSSSFWDVDSNTSNVGAVTWALGTTGLTGAVTSGNSMVGVLANDQVGSGSITALSSGNYVFTSPYWSRDTSTLQVGAVTWADGTQGIQGNIASTNSMIGATTGDQVGTSVTQLSNGNYVVSSKWWDLSSAATNVGAVTWASGTSALTGVVTSSNSLVGSKSSDAVGGNSITPLANGGYVVASSTWDNGALADVGAVTIVPGATGMTGMVSSANSFIGASASDKVGVKQPMILSDGRILVVSPNYKVGGLSNAGRVDILSLSTAPAPNATEGFSSNASGSSLFTATELQSLLNAGTAVTLQASNDITVSAAITANNPSGNGGALTLQAGRSISVNANITTDNGNLTLIANDTAASGVVNVYRAAGAANITQAVGTGINAGTGAVNFDLRDGAGNTNQTAGVVTLAGVNAASLSLQSQGFSASATAGRKTYDAAVAATVSAASISGLAFQSGSNLSSVNPTVGTFAGANAGTGLTVTSAPFQITGYNASQTSTLLKGSSELTASALADISKAQLTLTANNASKIYGNANPALSATVSGFVNSENLSSSGVSGSGAASTTASQTSAVGHAAITVAVGTLAASNYDFTVLTPGTLTINQRPLTVSGITADNKVYNGTTAASINTSGAVLTGLIAGDSVTVAATGAFADKNAASAKTVALTSVSGGADLANYAVVDQASTTANITPASLVVTGITASNKVYNGTAAASVNASGAVLSGLIAGDNVTVAATGMFSNKNVSVGKTVTLSSINGGADVGNYTVTHQASTTASITPAALVVSGVTAASRTYDGTTAAAINMGGVVLAGLIAGDIVTVTTTGSFADKTAAASKAVALTSVAGGADMGNYAVVNQTTATANITPAALVVSGITASDKVYNGTTAASVNAGGAVLSGLIAGDNVTVAATGVFANKNVSAGKTVTLSSIDGGADVGNYTVTQQVSTTASITPAALVVSGVTAASRTYDGTTAAAINMSGAVLTGLIAGDNVTVAATGLFADKAAAVGKTVALTSVSGGADLANYAVVGQASTTANIAPAALLVGGITAASRTYDGTTAAAVNTSGAVLTGLIAGDIVTVTTTGSFADKNAAASKAVALTSVAGGVDMGNYAVVNQTTATANITPAALVVSGITASNKVYNGTAAASVNAGGAVLSGLIAGDNVTVAATGVFSNKNVSAGKTVTLSSIDGGADVGNYTVTQQVSTTASITRAALVVSGITAAAKTYDGTTAAAINTGGAVLIGLIGGDDVTVAASGAFISKNAGLAKTVALTSVSGGADLANYALVDQATATASISPARLVIAATPDSKVYDGTLVSARTPTVSGLVGGDSITTLAAQTFDSTNALGAGASALNVNSGSLIADGNGGANYRVTLTSATGTITPLALSATLNYAVSNATSTYGTLATLGAASLSGLVGNDVVNGTVGAFTANAVPVTLAINTPVGTYVEKVTGLTGAQSGNYVVALTGNTDGILTINPLAVTLAGSQVYNGGTAVGASHLTAMNLLAGDALTLTGAATMAAKHVQAGGQPLSSLAGLTLDNGNYTVTGGSGVVTVTPAALTVSGITAANKVYNGTAGAAVSTSGAVLTGLIAGDNVTVAATGSFADKNVAAGKRVTLTSVDGGSDLANYTVTNQASTTASITAAALVVSGITAANKVYDGTMAAAVSTTGTVLTGLVIGDDVKVAATGTFADKNAAAGKTVALTSTDSGADVGNYAISKQTATTADISKAALTVSGITAGNKVYDGTMGAAVSTSGAVLTGLIAGDSVTVAATGLFADKNVAAGKTVTLTSVDGGADLANYTVVNQASTTADITLAALTITAQVNSKTSDGSTHASARPTVSGLISGDSIAGLTEAYADSSAGAGKTLTINSGFSLGDGNGGNNYAVALVANHQGVIIPAAPPALVVTAVPSPASAPPALLVIASPAASLGAQAAVPVTTSGVTVSSINPASAQQQRSIEVAIPGAMATAGGGFVFSLPAQLVVAPAAAATGGGTSNRTVSVTTAAGQDLPSWLRFNPETNSFGAASVPEGGLPLSLVVSVGGVSTVINITAVGPAGK